LRSFSRQSGAAVIGLLSEAHALRLPARAARPSLVRYLPPSLQSVIQTSIVNQLTDALAKVRYDSKRITTSNRGRGKCPQKIAFSLVQHLRLGFCYLRSLEVDH